MNYQPWQPYGYTQPYNPGVSPQNAPGWGQSPGGVSQPQPPQGGFQCRPVTGKEEALGVLVDCFSPGTLMPDLAHGVVYLKRFNNATGASDLYQFALVPPAGEGQRAAAGTDSAPLLENISDRLAAVAQRVDALFGAVERLGQSPERKEAGAE